jgi:hypothetical protein
VFVTDNVKHKSLLRNFSICRKIQVRNVGVKLVQAPDVITTLHFPRNLEIPFSQLISLHDVGKAFQ